MTTVQHGLEVKFSQDPPALVGDMVIEGYASLFGLRDQGGDMVARGAYAKSLERMRARGGRVRMLWQHDPAQPIGIWDEIREDDKGLWVRGRLLPGVTRATEAAALIAAGALDGLSIGYRTLRAQKSPKGGRVLEEIELWEVSLVTFPMLREARLDGIKADQSEILAAITKARAILRG